MVCEIRDTGLKFSGTPSALHFGVYVKFKWPASAGNLLITHDDRDDKHGPVYYFYIIVFIGNPCPLITNCSTVHDLVVCYQRLAPSIQTMVMQRIPYCLEIPHSCPLLMGIQFARL